MTATPVSEPPLTTDDLLGTWRLVDYLTRDALGAVDHPLGAGALGLLVYTADGYMSGAMQRAGRAPFDRARSEAIDRGGTDEEVRRAFDDFFGYAGRFRFDPVASAVHHIVEVCSVPGWDGRETVRSVERSGADTLTYTTPPRVRGGVEQRGHLVWRRA